jgi:hypothetical protein
MLEVGVKFALASGPEIADLARKAEAAGYDWLWVSERVAVPVDKPHPYDPSIDPWIALAYLAGATERIRLGTVVSQIALRDPVLMARELATLDMLSRGRMVVGAGAGWVDMEFEATNVPFGTRGARLNEFPGASAPLDRAGAGLGGKVLPRASHEADGAGNPGRSAHLDRRGERGGTATGGAPRRRLPGRVPTDRGRHGRPGEATRHARGAR